MDKPDGTNERELQTIVRDGKRYVRDPVRRQFVRLTPEERVRQGVLEYLIRSRGVPPGLISVERAFVFNGMTRRADILVYDRSGAPLILVECKAPATDLTQAVFDQAGRYNAVVGAQYVLVTNGSTQSCFRAGPEGPESVLSLPTFENLTSRVDPPLQ